MRLTPIMLVNGSTVIVGGTFHDVQLTISEASGDMILFRARNQSDGTLASVLVRREAIAVISPDIDSSMLDEPKPTIGTATTWNDLKKPKTLSDL